MFPAASMTVILDHQQQQFELSTDKEKHAVKIIHR
jgi:hypothetical protein